MTKTNKPNFPWLTISFILCAVTWTYLLLVTEMLMINDAMGYESLGRLLSLGHWKEYFTTGPNREPLYPLIISWSMRLGENFSLSYQTVQKIIQISFLIAAQILVLKVLDKCNIRDGLKALCILYLGFSPALTNSALSLYSEIATYPLVLLAVLLLTEIWKSLPAGKPKGTILSAVALGLVMLLLTFTKGIFELITPLLMLPFLFLLAMQKKSRPKTAVFAAVFALIFFLPILGYKFLNNAYNNNFVLTNRGSAAFYGNTVRAAQKLDPARITAALSYIPDAAGQFCLDTLPKEGCTFWSYKTSDAISQTKVAEMIEGSILNNEQHRLLFSLAAKEILKNPLQYFLLRIVEGSKLFFWESTSMGSVVYPDWISRLYESAILNRALSWMAGAMTIVAFFTAAGFTWRKRKDLFSSSPASASSATIFCIFLFLLAYIAAHSLFLVLPRYALPAAPLYLILIAFMANGLTRTK